MNSIENDRIGTQSSMVPVDSLDLDNIHDMYH
jgi:hypothetical protein